MRTLGGKSMKKVNKIVWLILILVCSWWTDTTIYVSPTETITYIPHDPIQINGNAGFTYGNGVVSGSGNENDPYIIEGWDIVTPPGLNKGISIRGTDSHFVIRNCRIKHGREGIFLYRVKNAEINNCYIENTFIGICLYSVSKTGTEDDISSYITNLKIHNNTLISNAHGIRLRAEGWTGKTKDITAINSNISIENNLIFHDNSNSYGIQITSGGGGYGGWKGWGLNHDITIRNNVISSNSRGIYFWAQGGDDNYIDRGEIFNINITQNLIVGNNHGVVFETQGGGKIYNNRITFCNISDSNSRGIYFKGSNNRLYHNYIIFNNLVNNLDRAYDNSDLNYWDNGSVGNYWSDYAGEDINDDGIGEMPYLIPGGKIQDNYPLINLIDDAPKNHPPSSVIISVVPNPAYKNEEIYFYGEGNDVNDLITEYNWSSSIDGFLSNKQLFNTSNLSSGNHIITFKVKDVCGKWSPISSTTLHITSNQIPSVIIETPAEGATVSGTVSINGNANDSENSLQKVEVRIDSGSWQTASGGMSWSYQWDTSNVSDGNHTIYARSYDGINYSDTVSVTVNVDNSEPNDPPTVTVISPDTGETLSGTIFVSGTADDSDGDIQSVQIRIDSGSWQTASGQTSWGYGWDTTTVTDGSHTIYIRSYDGTDYSNIYSLLIKVENKNDNNGGIPGFDFLFAIGVILTMLIHKRRKTDY